ncbi:hypothetical protein [Qipengyuania aestuarii]|uniref:hypothetical protein n=1 Tax=Qipengyuania aestuarii TaxID=2867241 RepID=UPI001FFCD47F|nr:hypothetical protein [Qipengyuania aestuarii]
MLDRRGEIRPGEDHDVLIVIVGIDASDEEILDLALHRAVLSGHFACTQPQCQGLADIIVVFGRKDVKARMHGFQPIALDEDLAPKDLRPLRGV